MRITIDLEPHELSVANELLNSLKSLTDQLQIRRADGSATPTPLAGAATAAASSQSTASAFPPPAMPATAASGQPAAPAATPPPRPAELANGNVPPEKRTPCYNILLNLTDPTQVDTVASQLSSTLMSRPELNEAVVELVDAFETVVFQPHTPGVMPDTDRVERYFQLLANKLPEHINAEFRKGVLQRVLRHLTKQRDVDVDRAEVVPYAVAFAALARLECVKIAGSLQTIERLLTKPPNRTAAITMLGYTLSTCSQLVGSAPQEVLDKVWQGVDAVADSRHPNFMPDVEYIRNWRAIWQQQLEPPNNLPYHPLPPSTTPGPYPAPQQGGAAQPAMHPATAGGADRAAAPGQPGHEAGGAQTLVLNSEVILQFKAPGQCMAWDAASASALVSCTDGGVSSWHVASQREHARLEVPGYAPASCISTHPTRGQMLLAANPMAPSSGGSGAYLALHSTMQGLPRRGVALRHPGTVISSTLLLPHDESTCCSCESWTAPHGASVFGVCLWDIARFGGAPTPGAHEEMRPLHTYTDGHSATITCSATAPGSQHLFFTGAQDGLVRVWDTRMRQSSGVLAVQDGRGKAHSGSVAAMDASGHTLVTAGSDAALCMWDVRTIGSGPVVEVGPWLNMAVESPGVPIFKVAFHNAPSPNTAALATGSGLYLLDWADAGKPTMTPTPGYHGTPISPALLQHDIVWAPGAAPAGGLALLGRCQQALMTVFGLRYMEV